MSTFPRHSDQTATQPAPQISEDRRQTVETARRSWIRNLIDLSRRNNLLYFRPLKTGTLELTSASSERLRDLLIGERVSAAKLLPNLEDDLLAKILRDISRRALENSEEKGLSTLFVTLGMATWPALDGGRPAGAPVLLLPITISKKEGSNSYYLSAAGGFQLNLVLLHVLEDQFKVKLQPEELLAEFAGEEEEGKVLDIKGLCGKIQRLMADARGFEIGFQVVLGNFAFQKMAMVKDLQERASDLPVHDVIAAIAGDSKAKSALNAEQTDPDPREFDCIPPDIEFLVLDADSSQQRAIAAVLADQSRVIHGPPGTGKSQTITNLIASLAAAGRRILFVAEKKAALEVVKRRLEEVGLGHLAIDLHGADLSPKKVMLQVAHALEVVRSSVPVNCQQVHAQLVERRGRLNSHVERMHCHREPTGMSVYEMQGLLLRLGRTVNAATRWRGAELARLTPSVSQQVTDLLAEAGGLASLFLRTDLSPWTGATLADGEAVQRALDLVQQMRTETWPECLASIDAVVVQTGLKRPTALATLKEFAELLESVERTLSNYSQPLYQQNLESILHDLSPGRNGGLSAAWALCTSGTYRRARATILSVRNGKAPSKVLFSEVTAAGGELKRWATASDGKSLPMRVDDSAKHVAALERLSRDADILAKILPERRTDQFSLDEVTSLTSALEADRRTPFQLPKLHQIERSLEAAGVGKLVAEIRLRKPETRLWLVIFRDA